METQESSDPHGAAASEGEHARPMRADARRNYEHLVAVAREVFDEQGGEASMDAIARQAGVGVGTLYRHFPKRIDLVEAVYQNDVDELVLTAEKAHANLEPFEALSSWFDAFLRYALGKRRFLNELREAFEKHPDLQVGSRERIEQCFSLLLDAAQDAGEARADLDGADLMQLVGAMCISPQLAADQGRRLLTVLLDGLRVGSGDPTDAPSPLG